MTTTHIGNGTTASGLNPKFNLLNHFSPKRRIKNETITRAHLVGQELNNFTLLKTTLTDLNIMGSTLKEGRIVDSKLISPNFSCTRIRHCHFTQVEFKTPSFRQTLFEHCTFENCQFESPNETLESLQFKDTLFISCDPKKNPTLKKAQYQDCLWHNEPQTQKTPTTEKPQKRTEPKTEEHPPEPTPNAESSGRFDELEV